MQYYDLKMIHKHPVVTMPSGDWFVDTGAEISIADNNITQVTIDGVEIPLKRFNLVSMDSIRELINHSVVGLLGIDILHEFNVLFDLQANKIGFSRKSIKLDNCTKLTTRYLATNHPVVSLFINDEEHDFIFDTGAQFSFWDNEALKTFPEVETASDYNPIIGTFQTDLYRLTARVGVNDPKYQFDIDCGTCDDHKLKMLISTAPSMDFGDKVSGILGSEFLNYFKVLYSSKGMSIAPYEQDNRRKRIPKRGDLIPRNLDDRFGKEKPVKELEVTRIFDFKADKLNLVHDILLSRGFLVHLVDGQLCLSDNSNLRPPGRFQGMWNTNISDLDILKDFLQKAKLGTTETARTQGSEKCVPISLTSSPVDPAAVKGRFILSRKGYEAYWDTILTRGNHFFINDNLVGFKIPLYVLEPGIALLVKAISAAGVCTTGSCDGHGETQAYISALSWPHAMWMKKILQIIQDKFGKPLHDWKVESGALYIKQKEGESLESFYREIFDTGQKIYLNRLLFRKIKKRIKDNADHDKVRHKDFNDTEYANQLMDEVIRDFFVNNKTIKWNDLPRLKE